MAETIENLINHVDNSPMIDMDTPVKLNRTSSNGSINEVCCNNATMSAILNQIVLLESNVSRLKLENIKLKNGTHHSKKLNNEHSDIYNLEKDVANLQQYSRRWNVEICNILDDVTQEN